MAFDPDDANNSNSEVPRELINVYNEKSELAEDAMELHNNDAVTPTSLCLMCKQATSKKDRSIECSKCRGFLHYKCTRLPAYAIYALRDSKRKHVCESCSAIPEELLNDYDDVVTKDAEAQQETLNDIQLAMKSLADRLEKTNIRTLTESINTKYDGVHSTVQNLEKKFLQLEQSIVDKFEIWKLEALSKISGDTHVEKNNEAQHLVKQVAAQENEISLSQSELTDKIKRIESLNKHIKSLTEDCSNKSTCILELNNEVDILKLKGSTSSDNISKLEDTIKSLELQIGSLNGLNNLLVITNNEKDNTIAAMQEDIRKINLRIGKCEGEKVKAEEFVQILQQLLQKNNEPVHYSKGDSKSSDNESSKCGDVFIYHDSLFKGVLP